MRRVALTLCLLAPAAARAEAPYVPPPEPRIEVGIGALAMGLPDYRGSDHYGSRVLPIPYLAYRTERVQLTREGLRARLFALDRLTASFSAAASLPGNDDNPDRAGMPQIDPTFEAGPSLDYLLHDGGRLRIKLRVPARATTAADGLELRDVGWVFVPHLRFDVLERPGRWEWSHLASLGALWASEDYHEYFYGVAPQYADPALNRPAYDAHGGYSGARVTLSSAVHHQRWRLGAFMSYDYLGGVAFEDSPLLRTEHSAIAGLYFSYRLYASGVGEGLEDAP